MSNEDAPLNGTSVMVIDSFTDVKKPRYPSEALLKRLSQTTSADRKKCESINIPSLKSPAIAVKLMPCFAKLRLMSSSDCLGHSIPKNDVNENSEKKLNNHVIQPFLKGTASNEINTMLILNPIETFLSSDVHQSSVRTSNSLNSKKAIPAPPPANISRPNSKIRLQPELKHDISNKSLSHLTTGSGILSNTLDSNLAVNTPPSSSASSNIVRPTVASKLSLLEKAMRPVGAAAGVQKVKQQKAEQERIAAKATRISLMRSSSSRSNLIRGDSEHRSQQQQYHPDLKSASSSPHLNSRININSSIKSGSQIKNGSTLNALHEKISPLSLQRKDIEVDMEIERNLSNSAEIEYPLPILNKTISRHVISSSRSIKKDASLQNLNEKNIISKKTTNISAASVDSNNKTVLTSRIFSTQNTASSRSSRHESVSFMPSPKVSSGDLEKQHNPSHKPPLLITRSKGNDSKSSNATSLTDNKNVYDSISSGITNSLTKSTSMKTVKSQNNEFQLQMQESKLNSQSGRNNHDLKNDSSSHDSSSSLTKLSTHQASSSIVNELLPLKTSSSRISGAIDTGLLPSQQASAVETSSLHSSLTSSRQYSSSNNVTYSSNCPSVSRIPRIPSSTPQRTMNLQQSFPLRKDNLDNKNSGSQTFNSLNARCNTPTNNNNNHHQMKQQQQQQTKLSGESSNLLLLAPCGSEVSVTTVAPLSESTSKREVIPAVSSCMLSSNETLDDDAMSSFHCSRRKVLRESQFMDNQQHNGSFSSSSSCYEDQNRIRAVSNGIVEEVSNSGISQKQKQEKKIEVKETTHHCFQEEEGNRFENNQVPIVSAIASSVSSIQLSAHYNSTQNDFDFLQNRAAESSLSMSPHKVANETCLLSSKNISRFNRKREDNNYIVREELTKGCNHKPILPPETNSKTMVAEEGDHHLIDTLSSSSNENGIVSEHMMLPPPISRGNFSRPNPLMALYLEQQQQQQKQIQEQNLFSQLDNDCKKHKDNDDSMDQKSQALHHESDDTFVFTVPTLVSNSISNCQSITTMNIQQQNYQNMNTTIPPQQHLQQQCITIHDLFQSPVVPSFPRLPVPPSRPSSSECPPLPTSASTFQHYQLFHPTQQKPQQHPIQLVTPWLQHQNFHPFTVPVTPPPPKSKSPQPSTSLLKTAGSAATSIEEGFKSSFISGGTPSCDNSLMLLGSPWDKANTTSKIFPHPVLMPTSCHDNKVLPTHHHYIVNVNQTGLQLQSPHALLPPVAPTSLSIQQQISYRAPAVLNPSSSLASWENNKNDQEFKHYHYQQHNGMNMKNDGPHLPNQYHHYPDQQHRQHTTYQNFPQNSPQVIHIMNGNGGVNSGVFRRLS